MEMSSSWTFIVLKIKLIFISKVVQQDSFLGIGLLSHEITYDK